MVEYGMTRNGMAGELTTMMHAMVVRHNAVDESRASGRADGDDNAAAHLMD